MSKSQCSNTFHKKQKAKLRKHFYLNADISSNGFAHCQSKIIFLDYFALLKIIIFILLFLLCFKFY